MEKKIEHCLARIAVEERLASQARSTEQAQVHRQVVMLYKAQLANLKRYNRLARAPAGEAALLE